MQSSLTQPKRLRFSRSATPVSTELTSSVHGARLLHHRDGRPACCLTKVVWNAGRYFSRSLLAGWVDQGISI